MANGNGFKDEALWTPIGLHYNTIKVKDIAVSALFCDNKIKLKYGLQLSERSELKVWNQEMRLWESRKSGLATLTAIVSLYLSNVSWRMLLKFVW